jgi:hypothetical protein
MPVSLCYKENAICSTVNLLFSAACSSPQGLTGSENSHSRRRRKIRRTSAVPERVRALSLREQPRAGAPRVIVSRALDQSFSRAANLREIRSALAIIVNVGCFPVRRGRLAPSTEKTLGSPRTSPASVELSGRRSTVIGIAPA